MEDITFVVFGGTGDLAKSRILPAIALLYENGKVGKQSVIIAIGRRDFNDASFADFIGIHNSIKIIYLQADIEGKIRLEKLPQLVNATGNKSILHYLSISYRLFGNVTVQLKELGLNQKPGYNIKIVYEKPFGHDLASAIELDNALHKCFDEDNVYRVDHFLGKETVQNLLVLRFANPLFERIWNSNFVEKIRIIGDEDIGVMNRLSYYDETGAMKDMVQNHMLQLAAFVLMESPLSLDPTDIQDQKARALSSLYIKDREDVSIAQYEGYRDEARPIRPNSNTETYAALRIFSKMEKWRGVPILISTGKMLPKKYAEIVMEFKKDTELLFSGSTNTPNKLIIRIQPMQEILLEINSKKQDSGEVEPVVMTFSRDSGFSRKSPETYAKIINEAILGNKTMFIRSDEIREAWRLIDKALSYNPPLLTYPKNGYPTIDLLSK
jgi:glucose-6-phosphate 1-dehydrogenase